MANQPPVVFSHSESLLAASGTEATGAETRVLTSSLIGTHQGLDVMIYGTPDVNAVVSGGSNVNVVTGTQQTMGTVGTVNGMGTLAAVGQIHNAGTLQGGSVQINKVPVQLGTPIHTLGTAGAAFWGTIVAASGAGTKQYVSRVSITGVSGTVVTAVTNIGVGGSTGAGVLERMTAIPSGGITNNYDPIIPSGTNGTLSYWLGGAGTVDIVINYWQGT